MTVRWSPPQRAQNEEIQCALEELDSIRLLLVDILTRRSLELTLVGRGFTPRQAGRKGPPYVTGLN